MIRKSKSSSRTITGGINIAAAIYLIGASDSESKGQVSCCCQPEPAERGEGPPASAPAVHES
ncbi:MAG: hypothetical protein ACXW5J_30355, partial [Thermoanaerobaculia bacterium]